MLAIRHDAKQPVAIAKALGIDPAAVTRQVEQLVRKGYVRRTRSGVDRRALYVELTEKAERALPTLQSAAHRADRMLVDGLRPEEIRALQTAARRIIANARTMEPPDRPEGMPGED
ncbi:MarR family transcriptional regulator [bacterium]|nr:MarR family transcriptional regulator [bacterium]MBU1675482.1 MarR family transcriptional regulator [bacterium]